MNDINLTEANFLLFAAQHYDSVFPDTVEFYDDLKRFAYLKRLFNLYTEKGELKERLIINHLIIIYNMWGIGASPMLFLKLSEHESLLKTFLVFLKRMPEKIEGIGLEKRVIISKNIQLNKDVFKILVENV